MLAIDYQGVGIIITAVFAGIASCISVYVGARVNAVKKNTDTPNGDPRTGGQILTDVANKVGATVEAAAAEMHDTTPAVPDGK